MKTKQLAPIALIFTLAILLFYFYKPEMVYHTISGQTQGTTYHIKYQDSPRRKMQPKIENLLAKFDMSLSAYKPESVISKINLNDGNVRADRFFKKVFHKAEEVYHVSDGAFDITIGPIVNAWGFGPGKKADVDSVLIDSLMQFVGMDKVQLKGNTISKEFPEIQLDVNAIAQGYSADVVAEFLKRKGINNYMVEIGGEVVAKGFNPDTVLWKIGIDKPIDNNLVPGQNLQAIVQLKDKALATSGNYRKFYEKDGAKYAHSINPKTGYPIMSKLLSVTVMANDCMTADAYATAFMVMGLEKSVLFLSEQDYLDALLIYSDDHGNYKVFTTPGMKDCILEME